MDLFDQRKIYSVSEISAELKRTLETFGIIWIRGEISNFKRHTSGHMYFALKDDRAQIKAAFFRGSNYLLKFRPEDGLEVLARGRLSLYEPRGDYQIIVEYMEPVGLGSLQLAFEQLKDRLRKEGLFDEARKRPLPLLPGKVGIVTSPTGAAIRDMLRVLARRNASLDIVIYPARVQGQGAAEEVAAGIRYFNSRPDIDVIIAGRGGGSIEDLWAFNEETVARAIYTSRIPVVSAVGHEVDFTIADFVADLRAPTPSAAAEMVSGARDDLLATVRSLESRLAQALRLGLEKRRVALERLARNRAFNVAPNKIRDFQQSFDEAANRVVQAMRDRARELRHSERIAAMRLSKIDLKRVVARGRELLAHEREALGAVARTSLERDRAAFELSAARMNALSPLAVLERGYAICRDQQGSIVLDALAAPQGSMVNVRLARGALDCRVESSRELTANRKPE